MTMRDRWDHLKKNVEENQVVKKTKSHISRNKDRYIIAGVSIAGMWVLMRDRDATTKIKQTHFLWKSNGNTFVTVLEDRTSYAKPVKLTETGEIFPSGRLASHRTGINQALISRNANGHIPHAGGCHFEFVEPSQN